LPQGNTMRLSTGPVKVGENFAITADANNFMSEKKNS